MSKSTQPKSTTTETNTMKKINLNTFVLSLSLTFFITLVATTVATWFLFGNIHEDARATVVQDIQLVQTTTKK